jgi:hypothetical protein
MKDEPAIKEPEKRQKQNGFKRLLEPYGCRGVDNMPFIHIGDIQHHKRWLIYISCNVHRMEDLLQRIMPILADHQVPFRIPIGRNELNEVNAGEYGYYLTGCAVTIYPRTPEEAAILAGKLPPLTQDIRAIAVPHSLHLGHTVYANYANIVTKGKKKGMVKFHLPKRHPFGRSATRFTKRPRLLAGRYVPAYIYSNRPKGDIFKAVDVQGFAFSWRFIKQGKAWATLDEQGRAMKERLLWQREVLRHLDGWAHAPRFLDYFEKGRDAYLVTELADGETLFHWVKKSVSGKLFNGLDGKKQALILVLFQRLVQVIRELHERGYVHRDITDTNFIISKTGEVRLVDFELCHRLDCLTPDPPFCYGTPGYLSPEQAKGGKPTEKEDIYSLGSLLLFMLTGERPQTFFERHGENAVAELTKSVGNEVLVKLISACRKKDPAERPTTLDICIEVTEILATYEVGPEIELKFVTL